MNLFSKLFRLSAHQHKSACTVPDNRAVLGSTDGNMIEMEEVAVCLVVL